MLNRNCLGEFMFWLNHRDSRLLYTIMLAVFVFAAFVKTCPAAEPNVLLFLLDDVGYGDLRVSGGPIATPNIERLANEGMRFTDFHPTAECSSTRAKLLTGVYPQRFTRDGQLDRALVYGSKEGLPQSAVTLAEVLAPTHGGRAIFGKWHLGWLDEFHPNYNGFMLFDGIKSSFADMNFPGSWYHNFQKFTNFHEYATTAVTEDALAFIDQNTALDRPWFIYLPYQAGHPPFALPGDPKGTDDRSKRPAIIKLADQSVGDIMDRVRTLSRPTFVFFTSDNGSAVVSSNYPFRGGKKQLYEGGIRTPAIAWMPGTVPAGVVVSNATVDVMDVLPTVATIVKAPTPPNVDGRSFAPLFSGKTLPARTLFWNDGRGAFAARRGPWKLVIPAGKPAELYNLTTDRGETQNVAAANPTVLSSLKAALAAWRKDVGR